MADRPYNVLFLCTGNSARSILAEALINQWGRGKFRGFSAGSHPKGTVHPIALQLLQRLNFPTDGLRSKSWDEFAVPGAAPLDFVFTVCDNAAGEVCPYWPGQPMTAHWGVPDPAAVEGADAEKWLAFRETFRMLDNRIKIFTSLPLESLDRIKLQEQLDAIGKIGPGSSLNTAKRLAAEGMGSALLAAAVVGSGVMAERLAGGNTAVALLANTGATVAVLATLIALLGPISGAHFNPAVSMIEALRKSLSWRDAGAYAAIQVLGCCLGVILAHAMFRLPVAAVVGSRSLGCFPVPGRDRGDVRVTSGCSGSPTSTGCALDARGVDRGCVLVHGIDLVCEPRHHDSAVLLGYVRRDSTAGCAGIRTVTACRRVGGLLRCALVILATG